MPVIVPGERADPIARSNAGAVQRIGELGGAPEDLTVRAAMPGFVRRHGNHRDVRLVLQREPHDLRDQERRVHHQALHDSPCLRASR